MADPDIRKIGWRRLKTTDLLISCLVMFMKDGNLFTVTNSLPSSYTSFTYPSIRPWWFKNVFVEHCGLMQPHYEYRQYTMTMTLMMTFFLSVKYQTCNSFKPTRGKEYDMILLNLPKIESTLCVWNKVPQNSGL